MGELQINMVTETLIYNLSNTNSSFNGVAGIRFSGSRSGKQKFHPQYIGA
jgi:hypothetical protein